MAIIQSSPSWQLEASVRHLHTGDLHLLITSLVPTARRPQHHVQLSGTLTKEELLRLRDVISEALGVAA